MKNLGQCNLASTCRNSQSTCLLACEECNDYDQMLKSFFSESSFWQEAKKGMAVAGKVNVTPAEEKTLDDEPLVYASKQVPFDFMSLCDVLSLLFLSFFNI